MGKICKITCREQILNNYETWSNFHGVEIRCEYSCLNVINFVIQPFDYEVSVNMLPDKYFCVFFTYKIRES